VNRHEQVWPFVCYGLTPEEDRKYVLLEEFPRLRQIAESFISNVDENGGRFFIDRNGAFCIKGDDETRGSKPEQFIEWRPDDDLPEERSQPSSDANTSLPPPLKSFREYLKGIRR
jgi:hypothetical protein